MSAVMEGPLRDLDSWQPEGCSIAKALDIVGTKSAVLVLREASYGTSRFEGFVQRVGISEAAMAAQLRKLTAAGLLTKVPYREPGQRTRHEYVLTDKGRDLLPLVFALMLWGNRYLQDAGGPLQVVDASGEPVHVELRASDGRALALEDVHIRVNRKWLKTRRPSGE